jgi:zinc protease
MSAMAAPLIPEVRKARPLKVPTLAERTLRNGLRIVAVRRPSVPRVELRLRIPAGLVHDSGDGARARLLPEVLLAGTRDRSSVEIAERLQQLGASISTHADDDDLLIHGGVLAENLKPFLALLRDVVVEPSFPADEVAVARDRIAQEIIIMKSQPRAIASEALDERLFGRHRYGRGLPRPDAVTRIGAAPIRSFHGQHSVPRGTTIVVVGDVMPKKALDLTEEALGSWRGRPAGATPVKPPPPPTGLPTLIVHRPGAVQTNIRVAGKWVPRGQDPSYALAMAHMVFGGYFSARLVKNIREDKGYTYSPGSSLDHRRLSSTFITSAEVGTEVTAPALMEIRYELTRIAVLPVAQDELDAARRYLLGVTMLSIQTQSGIANYLSNILAAGLGIEYLKTFTAKLQQVTTEDVLEAAAEYMTPKNLLTVLVGDADAISGPVGSMEPVELSR